MKTPVINQAMQILTKLRNVIDGQDDVSDKLNQLTEIIVREFAADAGSCYITVDDNYLELFAAYGYKEDISHRISMRVGDGLVGDVAKNNRIHEQSG